MSQNNTNNVDQIRDLIFGAQIREFEEKFERLERALQESESKLQKTFEASLEKFKTQTERSFDALEVKFDHFSASTQKDRANFKEQIDATDEALRDQIANHKEAFEIELKVIKENIADDNQKLTQDLEDAKAQILALIDSRLAAMADEKVSRESMAQMLLDVAMRLQGTTADSWAQAQHNDEEQGTEK